MRSRVRPVSFRRGQAQLQFLGVAIVLGMFLTSCVLQHFFGKTEEQRMAEERRKHQEGNYHTFQPVYRDKNYDNSASQNISIIKLPKL